VKAVRLPQEAIQVEDRWYVLATSSRAGEPARVLKHGESFALVDRYGDVPRVGSGEHGLYHQGTRYLSCHELRLDGRRPIVLNSSVRRDNGLLVVDATNPDLMVDGQPAVLKGTVHVARSRTLWEAQCHERLELANFGLEPVELRLTVEFAADFVDIFEGARLRARAPRDRPRTRVGARPRAARLSWPGRRDPPHRALLDTGAGRALAEPRAVRPDARPRRTTSSCTRASSSTPGRRPPRSLATRPSRASRPISRRRASGARSCAARTSR
jgi:glycogen debranching enzyme